MSSVVGARPALLLIGPTGSGKTPLGDEIERRGLGGRRCVHFDFGANLRSVAAGWGADLSLTGREVAAVRASLASGALFEDRDLPMIVKIVEGFAADTALGAGDLLVLNGLPRHVRQAEGLARPELVAWGKNNAAYMIIKMHRADPTVDLEPAKKLLEDGLAIPEASEDCRKIMAMNLEHVRSCLERAR